MKKKEKNLKEFEEIKKKAEFREARIVSVRAGTTVKHKPFIQVCNIRFEIKDNSGEFKLLQQGGIADTYYLSSLQPDTNIQVKVYDEYVFPVSEDARLYPD
jgi:hypothetical protein